ncbi:MAG: DUF4249 domain-containing protein [Bacteroidetes bacterium]|nr:DUF4249 domain-containing protein [Fibrella sp.]
MNRFSSVLIFGLAVASLSCETVIQTQLDTGPSQLSVDAILTDQPGPQQIRLTQTAAYFDNALPPVASSATVTVTDNLGKTFRFTDANNDGYYVWTPSATDTLGRVGRTYTLRIDFQNDTYVAQTKMNRVPPVDSITFQDAKLNPLSTDRGYRADFYATDFAGAPDQYRVRYYRNGALQNRTNDLVNVYNASFNNSSDTDGLLFIQPIRRAANPENLYRMNDTVKVELLSITLDSFYFLEELQTQLNNNGLFARPATNLPTNIINTNPAGRPATGYFMTSAVRSRTAVVQSENLRGRADD